MLQSSFQCWLLNVLLLIIMYNNQLILTYGSPVIFLMNLIFSFRELSALIIFVNDTSLGKVMIHRHGRNQPCYVTAIDGLAIQYFQWSSLVKEKSMDASHFFVFYILLCRPWWNSLVKECQSSSQLLQRKGHVVKVKLIPNKHQMVAASITKHITK